MEKPEALSYAKTLTENLSVEILLTDRQRVMLWGLDERQTQKAYDCLEEAIDELELPQGKSASFLYPLVL